ncbi:hypothetical protein N752_06125 [Desulforamulus aquiferis]|nr:hypothetical protein N752_06125 [Desulforamulus aquiferis]
MNYRIEEKGAFHIVGIKKRVKIIFNGVNPEIAAMWESLNEEMISTLKNLSDVVPIGLISASTNFSEGRMEEKGELDYYIGVATTGECPANLTQLDVQLQPGQYLKQLDPFLIPFRMFGVVSILNGFHHPGMNVLRALKYYGMRTMI